MNILIDSGNSRNIGDNAILYNVLNYLLKKTNWDFKVIDKNVPLYTEGYSNRINLVKNTSKLLDMPHWRIEGYKKQPLFYKKICAFLFWFISYSKALGIFINVKFYKILKKYLIPKQEIKYWSEIIIKSDAYWVVGGGNINDIWPEQAFWKMAFTWVFKSLNRPVIFSGQGIGPCNKLFTKLIVKWGVSKISLLALREKVSLDNLYKLGIKHNNFYLVTDDALSMPSDDKYKFLLPKKFIALNFRFSKYSIQNERLIDKFTSMVESFIKLFPDYQFIFIPIALNKGDSDIDTAIKIKNKLMQYENRIFIFEDITFKNIKSILKQSSLSIGVSYHFCLFSLSMGVPTVGLYANDYYKQKIKGLMQMFNTNNGAFDLRNTETEDLINMVKYSLREFDKTKILYSKAWLEQKWNEFIALAIKTVEGY